MSVTGWFNGMRGFMRGVGWYQLYVLLLMLLTYMLNQLDRYNLPILTQSMARDLHYGDKACFPNSTADASARTECPHEVNETSCLQHQLKNDTSHSNSKACYWDYNGQGIQYALLASILFVIVYTISGIFLGFAADLYKRTTFLAVSLFLWSVITLLTGFTNAYWQLVILRLGLGVAEAGCSPFATSILADIFAPEYRGTALGVYNWGIYTGYSLSYTLGDFVASIIGWRGVYYVAAVPGLLIAPLVFFTIREPQRRIEAASTAAPVQNQLTYRQLVSAGNGVFRSLGILLRPMFVASVLVLCIAGAIRNGAGYVWGFYTQPFFLAHGVTKETIGAYMTPIPLIGGCLSAVAGGFIADRVVKRAGVRARVLVLVLSQLLAAPFALGVLWLPVPWAFISLIPTYLFGEMWVAVCLAVFVEMIPAASRTFGIAVYFFIITNIGGNMPFLVPVIQQAFVGSSGMSPPQALRAALTILYPGSYVVSAIVFGLCIFFVKRSEHAQSMLAGDATPPVTTSTGLESKMNPVYSPESDDETNDLKIRAQKHTSANIGQFPAPAYNGTKLSNGVDNDDFHYGSTDVGPDRHKNNSTTF